MGAVRYVLAVAVLLPALAGCVALDGSDWAVTQIGDGGTYRYLASNGSRVEITIQGIGERMDSRQRVHDALVVEYSVSLRSKNTDATYEEAVSLTTGAVVQQALLCIDDDCDTPMVYFGSVGMPGGLGMGPLWAHRSVPPSFSFQVHSDLYLMDRLQLAQGPLQTGTDHCQRLGYDPQPPSVHPFQSLFSGFVSSFVVCPGEAVPREFEMTIDDRAYRFRIEGSGQPAGGPLAWGTGASPWSDEGKTLPVGHWWSADGPRYFFNDSELSRFPLPEAHEAALRIDSEYRKSFGQPENTVLLRTTAYLAGGRYPDPVWDLIYDKEETFRRNIMVNAGEGNKSFFAIEKTVTTNADGESHVSYRMVEPEEYELTRARETPFLHPDDLAPEQVDPAFLVDPFEGLYDMPPDNMILDHRLLRDHGPESVVRSDGYELRAMVRLPADRDSYTVGVLEMAVHGPSGTLLRLNVPPDRMPLTSL